MLERFMKEYLSEHLTIDVDSDVPNYVNVSIKIDGEVIAKETGSISVSSVYRGEY